MATQPPLICSENGFSCRSSKSIFLKAIFLGVGREAQVRLHTHTPGFNAGAGFAVAFDLGIKGAFPWFVAAVYRSNNPFLIR